MDPSAASVVESSASTPPAVVLARTSSGPAATLPALLLALVLGYGVALWCGVSEPGHLHIALVEMLPLVLLPWLARSWPQGRIPVAVVLCVGLLAVTLSAWLTSPYRLLAVGRGAEEAAAVVII
ncbi:MAG: hypothetical protein H0W83_16490, partial [Planctomycetes bacterium]|nr:hypothetical protein [Planctomycetota bacterium]